MFYFELLRYQLHSIYYQKLVTILKIEAFLLLQNMMAITNKNPHWCKINIYIHGAMTPEQKKKQHYIEVLLN